MEGFCILFGTKSSLTPSEFYEYSKIVEETEDLDYYEFVKEIRRRLYSAVYAMWNKFGPSACKGVIPSKILVNSMSVQPDYTFYKSLTSRYEKQIRTIATHLGILCVERYNYDGWEYVPELKDILAQLVSVKYKECE